MKYSIVFCADTGKLEWQSRLFISSVKANTSCEDIVAVVPKDLRNDSKIIQFLEEENVRVVSKKDSLGDLVSKPYGYKLHAYGVETDYEKRFILDTDTLILNELGVLNHENKDFLACPAGHRNFPSRKATWNETKVAWESLYERFNLKIPSETIYSVKKEKMYPYFNAGTIFIDGHFDFSKEVVEIAETVSSEYRKILPKDYLGRIKFLDQIAVPVAIKKLELDWGILPKTYNFRPWLYEGELTKKISIIPNKLNPVPAVCFKEPKILHYMEYGTLLARLLKNSVKLKSEEWLIESIKENILARPFGWNFNKRGWAAFISSFPILLLNSLTQKVK